MMALFLFVNNTHKITLGYQRSEHTLELHDVIKVCRQSALNIAWTVLYLKHSGIWVNRPAL